jgi:hypothetical protein
VKFVGIDLSANPRDCGICILEDDAVAHVSYGSKMADHPDWLVDLCTGADVVAVDVPFGWPKLFIETLKGYEIGTALERDRRGYRFREIDLWLTEELPRKVAHRWSSVPPKPLSVSTDKLGSTTMVGTILLEALAGYFLLSPRESSLRPASIEVYPAASLWAWSLPHTG